MKTLKQIGAVAGLVAVAAALSVAVVGSWWVLPAAGLVGLVGLAVADVVRGGEEA